MPLPQRRAQSLLGLLAIGATSALPACLPTSRVVQRAAIVPHAAPIARSGQPMGDNVAELALGADRVFAAGDPTTSDPEVGAIIPRYQGELAARMRTLFSRDFDFGLLYRHHAAKEATPVQSSLARVNRDGYTIGTTFHFAVPTSSKGFRLGLATELSLSNLPFVEYETCVGCGAGQGTLFSSREIVLGGAFAVIPSVRLTEWLSVFGGITARNHPVIDAKDLETSFINDVKGPESGPLVFIVNAGAEADLGGGLKVALGAYRLLMAEPVDYAPTVNAFITIPLSRQPAAAGHL